MKIAVFGAAGLFGEEIADVFEQDHEVVRFHNPSEGDVRYFSQIYEKLEQVEPDLIVNATGYRHPDNCKKNRDLALSINSLGPKNLALCAQKLDADFLHISSDSVFSGDSKWPYSEFDVPDAKTVYGFTKIEAEKCIRNATPRHFIIRVPMLFGFKGSPDENLMFDTWNKEAEGTVMYGATDQICNPTYTKDAAEALKMIAESGIYGTYHVSNEGLGSRYDLLKAFCALKGQKGEWVYTVNSEVKYDLRSTYTAFNPIAFKHTFDMEMDEWHKALERCYDDWIASKEG